MSRVNHSAQHQNSDGFTEHDLSQCHHGSVAPDRSHAAGGVAEIRRQAQELQQQIDDARLQLDSQSRTYVPHEELEEHEEKGREELDDKELEERIETLKLRQKLNPTKPLPKLNYESIRDHLARNNPEFKRCKPRQRQPEDVGDFAAQEQDLQNDLASGLRSSPDPAYAPNCGQVVSAARHGHQVSQQSQQQARTHNNSILAPPPNNMSAQPMPSMATRHGPVGGHLQSALPEPANDSRDRPALSADDNEEKLEEINVTTQARRNEVNGIMRRQFRSFRSILASQRAQAAAQKIITPQHQKRKSEQELSDETVARKK